MITRLLIAVAWWQACYSAWHVLHANKQEPIEIQHDSCCRWRLCSRSGITAQNYFILFLGSACLYHLAKPGSPTSEDTLIRVNYKEISCNNGRENYLTHHTLLEHLDSRVTGHSALQVPVEVTVTVRANIATAVINGTASTEAGGGRHLLQAGPGAALYPTGKAAKGVNVSGTSSDAHIRAADRSVCALSSVPCNHGCAGPCYLAEGILCMHVPSIYTCPGMISCVPVYLPVPAHAQKTPFNALCGCLCLKTLRQNI